MRSSQRITSQISLYAFEEQLSSDNLANIIYVDPFCKPHTCYFPRMLDTVMMDLQMNEQPTNSLHNTPHGHDHKFYLTMFSIFQPLNP